MVSPFVIPHPFLERTIVVGATADIQDQVVFSVAFTQISGDIFDLISVGLLNDVGGWEGHCDYTFGDVGEI